MLFRPGLVGRIPCPQDWYFGIGPPTIDDKFGTVLPAGWVFNRTGTNASNCLYTDGTVQTTFTTYPADTPRYLPFGLLIEPTRTNLFLNSEAPVTQVVNVVAGYYTVWMHGTGTVTVSGAGITPTSGSPTHGTPFTFYANGPGGVSIACSAPVTRVQVEAGSQPTSYIMTSATSATRNEDRLYKNYLSSQINASQGTYWVEFVGTLNHYPDAARSEPPQRLLVAGNGSYTSNNSSDQLQLLSVSQANDSVMYLGYNASGSSVGGSISQALPRPIGNICRVAMSVSPTKNAMATDYVFGGTISSAARPAALLAITLGGGGSGGSGGNHVPFNGFIRGFRYWPIAMSDAELKECTSPEYYRNTPPVFDLDGTNVSHWRAWSLIVSGGQSAVATDALMSDPPGTAYTQFATNTVPRIGPRGVLLDSQRFNYFANSAAMPASGTSFSVPAQFVGISIRGTGSITLTANTAVAAGLPVTVTQATPTTIQVTTTGTINFTCTGQVELAQLEGLGASLPTLGFTVFPATFIRTTTGNQSRGGLGMQMPVGAWIGGPNCTYYIEVALLLYQNGGITFQLNDGTIANTEQFYTTYNSGTRTVAALNVVGGAGQGGLLPDPSRSPPPILVYHKFAWVISDRKKQLAQDGILETTVQYGLLRALAPTFLRLGISAVTYFPQPCFIRRLRYYDYPIFDDDLVALTV